MNEATPRAERPSGTAAGFALVLWFALLPLLGGGDPASLSSEAVWWSDAVKWAATAAVLLAVGLWEGRPLRSIGLRRPRGREAAFGLAAAIFTLALMEALSTLVLVPLGAAPGTATVDALHALPLLQRASVVAAAAVSEEVLFRGFLMERVMELTGRAWPAVAGTVVLFVGGHAAHFGPSTLFLQAVVTLVFALLYLWRRDLTGPIVLHALLDGWGLIAVPVLGL